MLRQQIADQRRRFRETLHDVLPGEAPGIPLDEAHARAGLWSPSHALRVLRELEAAGKVASSPAPYNRGACALMRLYYRAPA